MTRRLWWVSTIVATLAISFGILSACSGNSSDTPVSPVQEADAGTVTFNIVIHNGGLDPSALTLQIPNDVLLHVTNESSAACAFSFGSFAQVQIGAGGEAQLEFTVDAPSETPTPQIMGCQGGHAQSGTITFEQLDAVS